MKSSNWKKRLKGPACYIFGAGEYYDDIKTLIDDLELTRDDLIIAADGGSDYLKQAGILPDVCIGDFDSCKAEAEAGSIIRLNPIKDTTDMAEAIECGVEKGYRRFFIFGGTGGRTAHTLANLQVLVKISKIGIEAFIVGKNEIFTAITGTQIDFESESEGYISVFAHSEQCTGVCETGLKYLLDNCTLTNDYPLGVSNEFTGQQAIISVKEGTLLIVFSKNAVIAGEENK